MDSRSRYALTAAILIAVGVSGWAQTKVRRPLWTKHSRTTIVSTAVLKGVFDDRSRAAIEQALVDDEGGYVEVGFWVTEGIKGRSSDRLKVTVFVAPPDHPHNYRPNGQELLHFLGRECIASLVQVEKRWFLADKFHNAAIVEASPDTLRAAQSRVSLHNALAKAPLEIDQVMATEVDTALRQMTFDATSQHAAVARLVELGHSAVPAIIERLGDRRRLPERVIRLADKRPNSSTPYRTHDAILVRDALLEILSHLTDERFGTIPGDLRDISENLAVRGWRIYAQHRLPGDVEPQSERSVANRRP